MGVYAGDRIPKRRQIPCCYIIDIDNSGEPGKHWIAIFEKLRKGTFPADYPLWKNFDSYKRSNEDYQQKHPTVCGDYCLYVLKLLNTGKTLENVLTRFDPHDKEYNNARVSERVHAEYPRILNTSTHPHINCQSCKSREVYNKKASYS